MARGYTYQLRTTPEVPQTLAELAGELGYVVTLKGAYHGHPSLPQLCADLAAAYRASPDQVLDAFRSLGIEATEAHPDR